MKTIRFWVWAICLWSGATTVAQVTQQVTAVQYYYNTDPGIGTPGNGAIIPVTPAADLDQVFNLAVPGSLSQGFHHLYMRVKDEFGRWSMTERRLFYIADIVSGTRNLVAYQYFFNSDPGVGQAGNGAVVPISSTATFNSSVAISLPGSLANGFHQLCIRTQDDMGRWSLTERRMFYISDIVAGTRNIVAYQYFFNTDPGTGVSGNGAIVSVPSTTDLNSTVAISLPGSLSNGFHQLYIRTKDDMGRWSHAERRMFYISDMVTDTRNIVAYQYFFDADPGAGNAGNGAIIPVSSTADLNSTIAISLPASLSHGFHQLYIRTKDDSGRWSLSERRMFYISDIVADTRNIVACQYFFDTDPGPGIAGTGGIIPITSTAEFNATIAITLPSSLNAGTHQLYIRTKDDIDRWSIAERRMFYISDVVDGTHDMVALEYYFDIDPGVRNANPYPISPSGDFNQTIMLGTPCLSVGTHYLFIRAKDTFGRWSIIDKDTFTITSGIEPSVVSPAGPVTICAGGSVVLSTIPVSGVTYQWVESGIPIAGETDPSLSVTTPGSYALRTICGSFIVSNTVVVSVLPQNTYYADADIDGYGDAMNSILDCVTPSGYVTNDDDCDDENASIHPSAPEACNLIDDDCDGELDEGVEVTFYADGDNDGYGDPLTPQLACTAPPGYVANNADCDDLDMAVNPAASETCNLIDDDCDGSIDEGVQIVFYADTDGDGFGNPENTQLACTQPAGYVTNDDDCNDGNMAVNPGGTETCNGLDDDCDGLTDDADPMVSGQSLWYADADSDGYGNPAVATTACAAPAGYVSNDDDCDDMEMDVNPGEAEICNGEDDDCDGLTDDADPSVADQQTWYADIDTDGFGDAASPVLSCTQPAGYVANDDDCDDTEYAINPYGIEVCNEADDDCDGQVDEGVQSVFYADADNDGFGNAAVTLMACTAPPGYVSDGTDCDDVLYYVYPGAAEQCNGEDDDCDGTVDEGFELSVAPSSISSSNGSGFCVGGSTLLSVEGGMLGSGAEWFWYQGGCGSGASIGTGVSLNVSPGAGMHTYFVRAQGTCNTSACATISITVYETPAFTSCPSGFSESTDAALCSALKNYSVTTSGSPVPTYSYEFTGATTGTGSGTGSGSAFNTGITTVTVTATNTCGFAECTFDIIITDTEDPMIVGCPDDLEAPVEIGQWGAHVAWPAPDAFDNCEVSTLTSSYAPGDFFVVGSTIVTYTATDIHDNTSTCTFTVTVEEPDVIGQVNISIFADDIEFSTMTPDTGDIIIVTATVRNSSAEDAPAFACRLISQFDGTIYADSIVPGLTAGQSLEVSWEIETPSLPAFVPMEVVIDQFDILDESNEFDNSAIRPFINGAFSLDAALLVSVFPESPEVVAGNVIQLCGDAVYDDTAVPLEDYSVAGAQVIITILETGEILMGTTNSDGHFCIGYRSPFTTGLLSFTAEVTDFTLTGQSDTASFLVTPPEIECPADLAVSLKLFGSLLCGNNPAVTAGDPATGEVTIRNDCQEISIPTQLFISAPNGTPLPDPINVPPLLPGQQLVITIPAITFNMVGTNAVTVVVDYLNDVIEVNEGNNTATKFLQVHQATPDIVAESAGINSTWLCQANEASVVIANHGGGETGPFMVNVDVIEGTGVVASYLVEVENIDPLCSIGLQFAFIPASGNEYEIHVVCDSDNTVPEISESNNEIQPDLLLRPCAPDLVLYDCAALDVKPADPTFPGTISVTATISNEGVGACLDPFDVWFDIAGTSYPYRFTQTIEVNEVRTISLSIPTPAPGDQILSVTVDALDEIAENVESNNTLFDSNQRLCFDFRLTNMRCDDTPAIPGSQAICRKADIGMALHNQTLYEATAMTLRYEISGPGLPPGWNLLGEDVHYMGNTCFCPFYLRYSGTFYYPETGLYSIRVTVDPENDYAECGEDNNVIVVPVYVLDAADYTTYSQYIALSQLNPEINEPISFNLSYENIGCSGEDSLEMFLMVDNTPLDSVRAMPLDSGTYNTYPMSQTWSSGLTGLHVVRVVVDHDDEISEINELNNEATRAVIVGTPPDFNVISVVPSTYNPLAGDIMFLTALVTNEGGSDANGMLRFYHFGNAGNEIPIDAQPLYLAVDDTIEMAVSWSVINPHARILVRAGEADPIEYDFSDNESEVLLNPMTLALDITDNACYSLDEGSIEVEPIGGKAPYFIQWSNGRNDTLIEATAGTYTVTVTDANGSMATAEGEIVVVGFPETRYLDSDGDGFGHATSSVLSCNAVPGYVMNNDDCNDSDASVHPEAQEICNGVDDDCDGLTDDDDDGITGQLTWYLDGDNDGFGRPDSLLNACGQPSGFVGNGNDCNDANATIYPDAPELPDAYDNDCDGLIDEGINLLDVNAGDCETVFLGYEPNQCSALSVSASGGSTPYSYQWSNGATTSSTSVCPEETAIYSVTVTDHNGFTAEDNVTVQVIDIRCGNNNNKVLVCHIPPGNPENIQMICIAPSAVQAHLDHGCYVGICDAPDPCEEEGPSAETLAGNPDPLETPHSLTLSPEPSIISGDEQISIVPNPADDYVMIDLGHREDAQFRIFDITGTQIMIKEIAGGKLELNTSVFVNGMYLLKIKLDDRLITRVIVIAH